MDLEVMGYKYTSIYLRENLLKLLLSKVRAIGLRGKSIKINNIETFS